MGDRFLSSASTGKNCALSMMFPDLSPVLDKNHAPMSPEMLSSTGAGVCRKAPKAFPDSSSVLNQFQSGSLCFNVLVLSLTNRMATYLIQADATLRTWNLANCKMQNRPIVGSAVAQAHCWGNDILWCGEGCKHCYLLQVRDGPNSVTQRRPISEQLPCRSAE